MPASVLAATPAVAYLALVQINLIGGVGSAVELAATAVIFLAGAWMAWRLAPVVAEAIIASPRIAPESIDAHLIRVSARLLGIVGSMALLAVGADRLGVPVYGIVAGLGVGGLAIALAAQPTVENLIGGLSLFADKPIRVGDVCKYGDAVGTVEAIGIRSSRIRGVDRTLTTIPNAALAKMPIVNLTQRDRMLIQTVIGLRYETTPEQLRYVLVKLRETAPRPSACAPGPGARAVHRVRRQFAGHRDVRLRDDPRLGGVPRHPGRHPAAGHGHRRTERRSVRVSLADACTSVATTVRMRQSHRPRKPACARGGAAPAVPGLFAGAGRPDPRIHRLSACRLPRRPAPRRIVSGPAALDPQRVVEEPMRGSSGSTGICCFS